MGTWIVGEYSDVDSDEILDLVGDEPGQPGVVRVQFVDGQDVMPRTVLEHQYALTPLTDQDWGELALEAEDEGPEVFASFQAVRARRQAA